jgi:hypothetical protein
MYKYMTLLAKMVEDCVMLHIVQTNFDQLFEINYLLDLTRLLPLIKNIHVLIESYNKKHLCL